MIRFVLIWVVLVLFGGCGKDFDPRTLLKDYRVIGIVAEPPEVGVEGTVQLTAIEHIEPNQMIQREWSICLFSLGVFADFACIDDSLIIELDETRAQFDLSLNAQGIDFLTRFFEGLSMVSEDLTKNEDAKEACGDNCLSRDGQEQTYIDVQIRLRSGPPSGPKMTTLKSVRVNFEPSDPNQNPELGTLTVDGIESPKPVKGGEELTLEIEIADESLQEYIEQSSGVSQSETPSMTWFTTVGELQKEVTAGDRRQTVLTLPATLTDPTVEVYVVVRDGRGGTAFQHATIPAIPNP